MRSVESEAHAVRRQLERVLESPGFARNERLSGFLRFTVERHLDGRDPELKESVIAIEVFGRKPDYNPKRDPVVRTEAARLRARLSEYYTGAGNQDTLVIELPKGGYTPVFHYLAEPARADQRRGWRALRLTSALAALTVFLAAAGWWLFLRGSEPIPIAVLPFTNLSQSPAEDYFADGITNEIIRNLSIIDGVAVRSQTSSFALKGQPRNIHDAGKQLAADYILEGSVLRSGQQLRINVQLVRVRDDFPVWSGRYDRELTDIFAIQDEVSRGVVNGLRLKLGRGRRRYETSVEAYDLYLRARALQTRGLSPSIQSIGPFEEAIAKDVSFAPAYAGLAAAYVLRSGQGRAGREDDLARMRATAEKAIQLDPLLAEAHDALGMSYARDGHWEESKKSFRHAIELDTGNSTSHDHLGFFLLVPLGRIEEGLHELQVAEKADPLSSPIHSELAYTLLSAGRSDEAASQCEKMSAGAQDKSECLGRARMAQGRIGEAIPMLAASPTNNWGYLAYAYAYARAGRRGEAEKLMTEAPGLYPNRRGAFQFALAFAGLADKDRTMEQLERMADLGPVRLGLDLTCPEFALLRGDPRVKALRKKVGLPE